MTATLLDGKKLAQTMQAEIAQRVAVLVKERGIRPGLAAVLVGDNPASQIYVRNSARPATRLACRVGCTNYPRKPARSSSSI